MGTVYAKDLGNDDVKIKLDTVRVRVDKVHFEGVTRTKDDLIFKTCRDLFTATDFQQVIFKANEVRIKLETLGCFKNVGISIDTSKDQHATPDGLEITFQVEEFRRLTGSANTMIGNNEGSLVLGAKFPNILGRGEKVQLEYSHGTKKTSGFNATFTKPFLKPWNSAIGASIYQQSGEYPWSGYKEIDRGVQLDLNFESAPNVNHILRWAGVWREMGPLRHQTSFPVREHFGHTLKSSVQHILMLDKRDNKIFPSDGVFFKLTNEFAGLMGDVGFHKHEAELQYNCRLPRDLVLQAGINAGFLRKLQNDKVVTIADKFFLGGPLNLRGFQTRGVGPQAEGSALGAETFWSGSIHLYSPLPLIRKGILTDLFRVHAFANAGNLGNFQFTDDFSQSLNILANNLRWAYGIGLILRVGQIARFELNYCIPVSAQSEDKLARGVQFGLGFSIL